MISHKGFSQIAIIISILIIAIVTVILVKSYSQNINNATQIKIVETPLSSTTPSPTPQGIPSVSPAVKYTSSLKPNPNISTPTPLSSATPSLYPREIYINPPSGAKVYINYLSSNQAKYGGSIIAKGAGFGTMPRWVRLINLTNPQIKEYHYTYLQGIISWQPNEVVFWTPADKGNYSLEIEGEDSVISNQVNLEVIEGSPNQN